MTVTNRKKRVDFRTSRLSDACDPINKQHAPDCGLSTSSDSCCVNDFDEANNPMTLPTPEDSTASWLDADDNYQASEFLDEAMCILHNEEEFSDAYHDRLRSEYEQWKIIPHLRIIGKRIENSYKNTPEPEDDQQSCQTTTRQTSNNDRDLDLLRDQVIKIMTETLWHRVLDKTDIKSVCQRQSLLESRRHSSGRMESALIVSSILPAKRPLMAFKSRTHILDTVNQSGPVCHGNSSTRYNKKPWSKNNVNVLPPIENHQKKTVDKTKRWFSAVNAPSRNRVLPRPVTSVTTHVNAAIHVCFDISIDGTSIKSLKKKGFCSPS